MKKILPVFLFFLLTTPVFAQETQTPTPTPAPVDYQLPYPGILPDSPLYFLKPLKDRIVGYLITDPLKKAEFDLLASDKRAAAADALFAKRENALAESTLSKGENYFQLSLSSVSVAKKQGFVISGMLEKLLLSSQKHLEIIKKAEITDRSENLKTTEKRVEEFESSTNMLLK